MLSLMSQIHVAGGVEVVTILCIKRWAVNSKLLAEEELETKTHTAAISIPI